MSNPARPFSQACENNKEPILQVLRQELSATTSVLEIGSGTGQHARYFAENLPQVCWQASDQPGNLAGIESWRSGFAGKNLPAPAEVDVRSERWSVAIEDAVFTANSLHIMAWSAVQSLFAYLQRHAPIDNKLLVYGPFNYDGRYTSESNAQFDIWLAQQHPDSAIRDFAAVDALASAAGYQLQADYTMPANNRLLVWVKHSQRE